MGLKLANNAVSRLATAISATDLVATLSPGDGSLFPAISAGDWFPATIHNASGVYEVVRVTERVGDTITFTRAQEGTAAQSFEVGTRIELRASKGVFDEVFERISALLPPGVGPIPWSLPTEPAGWIFANGRILLPDTPYQLLRSAYIAAGFPYGNDGAGNPRIPDCRGRGVSGVDGGAGRLSGGTLGAALGAQSHVLSASEMPSHGHGVNDPTHAHSVYDPGHAHGVSDPGHRHSYSQANVNDGNTGNGTSHTIGASANTGTSTTGISINGAGTGIGIYGAYTGISIQANGGGAAHNNVQPTLVANMIVKT